MNVGANQVLHQSRFEGLGIGEVDDANGDGCGLGHLRGTITPRSGDDLEALLSDGTHKQGREHSLSANAVGQAL